MRLDAPDALRQAIIAALAHEGGSWTPEAQLCRDLKKMPIEDASVEWHEKDAPFQPLATLTVPPQQGWSAGRSAVVDRPSPSAPGAGSRRTGPWAMSGAPAAASIRSRPQTAALTGHPIHEPDAPPPLDG